MNISHTLSASQILRDELEALRHYPANYYVTYLNDLADICEDLDQDEMIDIVPRLLEIVAPMFDQIVDARWSSRVGEALRLLHEDAAASAILHLIPGHYDLAFSSVGNGQSPIAKVQAGGEAPSFSYTAQCLPMALLSALLRAAAASSEVLRGA